MRSIAVMSDKGGTAKTTTVINVAVGLARSGGRTLVVDCDGQANASLVLLGGQGAAPPTLRHVLLNEADAADAVRPTDVAGLAILPADAGLAEVNLALAGELGRRAPAEAPPGRARVGLRLRPAGHVAGGAAWSTSTS